MTNLGRSYTEANEALASVNLSVILPQNLFAMLNHISLRGYFKKSSTAATLCCHPYPRDERIYVFQLRSNVYLIAYVGFLMPAED